LAVRICPIEEVSESFEERFLSEAFDNKVPAFLNETPLSKFDRADVAVPLAFSEALHKVLSAGEFVIPNGSDRHTLVSAAQQYELPEELRFYAPSSIAEIERNKLDASFVFYSEFLREFGIKERIVEEVADQARRQADQILGQQVVGPQEEAALCEHARKLLKSALPSKYVDTFASVSVPPQKAPKVGSGEVPLPMTECKVGNDFLPLDNKPLSYVIAPGKPHICRFNLTGNFNVLKKSNVLSFDFHSPKYPLMPDIVTGDAGFPTIMLVNSDGVHFSFARGNLKDFFDISQPNTRQRIELPLNTFVYENNMTSNVPLRGDFFARPIVKIIFDFLRHKVDPIDIELGNFAYREVREIKLPPVQDLVIFDRSDQVRSIPKFATERGVMTFRVALNSIGLALGYAGAQLKLAVMKNGTPVQEVVVALSAESNNVQLQLKQRGAYRVRADLYKDGKLLACEEWSACHVVSRAGMAPSSILGISDGAEYDRIAMAGGIWDRLVAPLALVAKSEKGFYFQPGLNPLPCTLRAPGQHRILSIFQMPKNLTRFPDRWDFHRYGPSDPKEYAEMISWLAESAYEAGFTHFEVWNEASAYGHWNDDMDTLIELHKITYEAIRKVVPSMIVLGGCTHSWDLDFLRRFFKAGGANYCDGLSIHGYTYQPALLPQRFDDVEDLIRTHVHFKRDFGLYVTEVGFRMPAFSEMAAAENLVLFTLEAASRKFTRAVLWFRYNNPRPEVDSGYQQRSSTGYALVGNNERYCRSSYAAYRFIDLLLGQSDQVDACGEGEGRVYRLVGKLGTIGIIARSGRILENMAPSKWRWLDCCGGPLPKTDILDSDEFGLFVALRPDFFV